MDNAKKTNNKNEGLHWVQHHMLFFCEFQLIYIDYAKKKII
jgi:hypothetical protein